LKQYNGRWFVFGLNEQIGVPTWNIALDRIQELTPLTDAYIPSTLDWEYYFSDIVGVTRLAGELEKIELLFSPQRAKYVLTKPLHESQWHQLREDGLFVRLKLVPNPELEQLILSFGEDVKVLQPESLATRISTRAQAMVGLYGNK
jgi:predicted DNA-binding transcriptional regulator YafY